MHKSFFFLCFFLFSGWSLAKTVGWNPYLMNQARFAHLKNSEQDKVIIQTMELMVALENQYQHKVVTQGFSWENYQRFTRLINVLISEAYAQNSLNNDFGKIGTDFKNLLNERGNRCIYAGWVSEIQNNYCVHPALLSATSDARKAYAQDPACKGPGKISCSPVIFGYKNAKDQSLFCVDAGINKAHNSSLECMKAALEENPKAPTDSKEARLTMMREQMASPKYQAAFDGVHQYIFQACACENKSPELNTSYHSYMRPHRTCYGLLNSLREIYENNSCPLEPATFSTSFFSSMKSFADKNLAADAGAPSAKHSLFDDAYAELLSNQEYKQFCDGAEPSVVTPTQAVADSGNEAKCIAECSSVVKEEVASWECIIKATLDVNGVETILKTDPSTATLTDEQQTQVEVITEDQKSLLCPVSIVAPVQEAPVDSCSITATADAEKKIITATAVYSLIEGHVVESATWASALEGATIESATFTYAKSLTLGVVAKVNAQDVSCEFTFEEAASMVFPTLSLTGKTPTATAKTIDAKVGTDGKLPDGFTVVWYRTGAKDLKLPVAEEKKTKEKPARKAESLDADGAEETLAPEAEKKVEEVPKLEGEVSRGKSLSITEPRSTQDYKTCAKLIRESDQKSSDGVCETIPKLAMPANNQGMQPQRPMRPASNTSARGIQ